MGIKGIDHWVIVVADLKRTLEFYRRLGFTIAWETRPGRPDMPTIRISDAQKINVHGADWPEQRWYLGARRPALGGADFCLEGAGTGHGVPGRALTFDWPELMRFKRSMIAPTTERTEQTWAKIGVEQFHGTARFVGRTTLAVGDDRLTGRRILIAAGAMPVPLRFPGAERLTTSEQFLDLDRLPPRGGFVGGGYGPFAVAPVAPR